MSTQHPDNVTSPPWSCSEVIEGEDEIREAYFAYNELGCQEVMGIQKERM
jgi:phosphoenolpyruvate carboxylase